MKLNVVVVRSLDQDLLGFAKMTLDRPLHVRFIEYMPVGDAEEGAGCHSDIGTVDSEGWTRARHRPERRESSRGSPSEAAAAGLGVLDGGRARRRSRRLGPGELLPAPRRARHRRRHLAALAPLLRRVQPPASDRRRQLRPCLFSDEELDVRTVLRTGTDEDVRAVVRRRSPTSPKATTCAWAPLRRMSQIGG